MDPNIFLQSDSDHYMMPVSQKNSNTDYFNIFQGNGKYRSQILPAQCSTLVETTYSKQKDELSNKDSSKKIGSLLAGKKARERKKKYIEGLEVEVALLQKQVIAYEQDIKKTKETLSQALNSTKNNENSITYSEMQLCIESEDPNEDKINLLLDMMKFRIGASGHERQAKIQYFFKQLISTLFPALHRYLMYCSDKNLDIFVEQSIDQFFDSSVPQNKVEHSLPWMKDFLVSLDMTQHQRNELVKMKPRYIKKKEQVKRIICCLKDIKQSIKSEQAIYESMIDEIRGGLKPIQGAIWVLFCDKFKYKKQISLDSQIQLLNCSQNFHSFPTKKRKME